MKLLAKRVHLARWTAIVLLALVYYGTAEIGRRIASTPQDVTPVWPPDGFASAAVLMFGYWVYPGIFIGAFLANVWAFLNGSSVLMVGVSLLKALSIGVGTTLGTLLGAYLLRQSIDKRNPLNHPRDTIQFVFKVGLLGPMVNATVGVLTLCLAGNVPWTAFVLVWLTWWISNVAGILIFTPVLLSWGPVIRQPWVLFWSDRKGRNRQRRLYDRRSASTRPKLALNRLWRILEVILLISLVLTVGWATFWQGYFIEYLLIPFLVWAAFRFGQRGATLLIAVVSAIAILGTVKGLGPFARGNFNESLILLQSFIGAVVVTTLMLVAVLTERQRAADILMRSEVRLREQAYCLEQTLSQLRNTQSQLIHTERISSLGQLVAGIAHEVNNPVSFICGNLTYAESYVSDLTALLLLYRQHLTTPSSEIQDKVEEIDLEYVLEDLPKILTSMKTGTDRIRDIMSSLRTFSRLDTKETQLVDIHAGIDSTLLILHHRLKAKSDRFAIQLKKDYGELPLVECYPGQLNQVFMNLLANAIDALEESNQENKVNTLDTEIPTRDQQDLVICIQTTVIDQFHIQISVADNGPGIAEADQHHLFDAFFTTKPAGKGTGLGLSISRQIVTEKHGGLLNCISKVGQGSQFVITMPIRQSTRI